MVGKKHAIDVNARALAQTGKMAIQRLQDIAEAMNIPCLREIAGASLPMMDIFLTVRTNKVECARMVEHVKTILLAIASICDAETELTPVVLRSIAAFSE
ncbi:hypothetical protein B0H10DRAFT_2006008 [Mycena sp. CBHHK59/15]|nr:hypothetical protein B0H10DRAFT_2012977 [Mycena sp. CBHHK59/15]KAJ6624756.1 hypothetical protein B0H10DRAFT_2006008 [Mycena sp. CBHHK59/15]